MSQRLRLRGVVPVLAAALMCATTGCKKKGSWLVGKWLLVEDGKPRACHEFKADRTFSVYVGSECKGKIEPLSSGKWQVQKAGRVAIQRGNEEVAHEALVNEKTEHKISLSGAITGALHKVGDEGAAALIPKLEASGAITARVVPPAMGCTALDLTVSQIKALPVEKAPRMIRARDQGLEYHANTKTGDAHVERIVYAVNQDQIDWIAFHLTEASFSGPGPRGRLEQALGKPKGQATTGKGDKQQQIAMWKGYCANKVRGATNKDIDITLFSQPAKKSAYYYVSEKVISTMWDELLSAANDPSQQAKDDDDGDGDGKAGGKAKPEAKAPAPKAPTPGPPTTAAKPVQAKPVKPAGAAATPSKAKIGRGTSTKAGLAVPGKADEI